MRNHWLTWLFREYDTGLFLLQPVLYMRQEKGHSFLGFFRVLGLGFFRVWI